MTVSKLRRRIAVIGCGKIGEAAVAGLLEAGLARRSDIRATTHRKETAARVSERLGIRVGRDNREAIKHAEVVILALKPAKMRQVCREIAEALPEKALVISLATGVSTKMIESWLPAKTPVVRAMPNTPILIRKGMTVLCGGKLASKRHLAGATELFRALGNAIVVEEEFMNAATGLSAGGPAYVYVIIESLAEAGVKVGLPRDLATQLAAQAVLGASSMVLESGLHPALLKDNVTTPAGVTIDGLMELEEGGLRVALIKAIVTSTKRAREIEEGMREKG